MFLQALSVVSGNNSSLLEQTTAACFRRSATTESPDPECRVDYLDLFVFYYYYYFHFRYYPFYYCLRTRARFAKQRY